MYLAAHVYLHTHARLCLRFTDIYMSGRLAAYILHQNIEQGQQRLLTAHPSKNIVLAPQSP